MKHLRLLFVTQKLHGQDVFTVQWVRAFERAGYEVTVVCLEWRPEDSMQRLGISSDQLPARVLSLGKESGRGKIAQILRFMKLTWTLRYDRVFVHMTPVWGIFGAPAWLLRRIPVYLWYTHYQMQLGLKLLGWYAKRMFCATPQSLPQYEGHPKKTVVGHGVDVDFWPKRANTAADPHRLLMVHRLARSKRIELSIRALTMLDDAYTLDIYGMEAELEYVAEIKRLVADLQLEKRVTFHGTVPMKDLAGLYASHRLILNMASETIDKTMLECMTCGCYPVTTAGNAAAIGLTEGASGSSAPARDTPEAIAAFVREHDDAAPLDGDSLYAIVQERHSLSALIDKMDRYIREGI